MSLMTSADSGISAAPSIASVSSSFSSKTWNLSFACLRYSVKSADIETGKVNAWPKCGDEPSRAYVSWFGFKAGDQQKRVANLSGGERNRVQLAKVIE